MPSVKNCSPAFFHPQTGSNDSRLCESNESSLLDSWQTGWCLSSIILSPLNGNVKMSPYEQGNICIEPERAATSGGYFQMREGGVGVCQSRRNPVPERAPN